MIKKSKEIIKFIKLVNGIRKVWNGNQNEVVIKKARPDAEHACQQMDYVSLVVRQVF